MPTPFPKIVLLALVALAAVRAAAQVVGGPDTVKNDPRFIAITAAEARARKLIDRARQQMREGKFAQAEALAMAAVREGEEVDDKDPLALGMLAEVYLAEGEPGVALSELNEFKMGLEPNRSVYLRAICLVRIGRPDEARRVLNAAAGDGKTSMTGSRSGIRSGFGLPLPMDLDDTPSALEATALLLRGEPGTISNEPEQLDDLRAAARLAPNNRFVHYALGSILASNDRFDEAVVEADRVERLGAKRRAMSLRNRIQAYRDSYAKRHPAKPL